MVVVRRRRVVEVESGRMESVSAALVLAEGYNR